MIGVDRPTPAAPDTLVARYAPADLAVFGEAERRRFLSDVDLEDLARAEQDPEAWRRIGRRVGWELLYRLEPELFDRLVAGEHLHAGILEWLPDDIGCGVEVAAGTGRLTRDLWPRCGRLIAVEPAAGLRGILRERVPDASVVPGFFDALPVRDGVADIVASCSAFTPDPAHGGDAGLAELERVCAPGGLVVFVWPTDVAWLTERGYTHETFPGEMRITFEGLDEAVELARIFYPDAVDEIVRRSDASVPYDLVGMHPPRDLCWKRVGS